MPSKEWESMYCDNRQFNINGLGRPFLGAVLRLAFHHASQKISASYIISPIKGFILCEYDESERTKGASRWPVPVTYREALPVVWKWLQEESEEVPCEGLDANAEHDGSNDFGWRVYVEDWGKVNGVPAVAAIRPSYLWCGK